MYEKWSVFSKTLWSTTHDVPRPAGGWETSICGLEGTKKWHGFSRHSHLFVPCRERDCKYGRLFFILSWHMRNKHCRTRHTGTPKEHTYLALTLKKDWVLECLSECQEEKHISLCAPVYNFSCSVKPPLRWQSLTQIHTSLSKCSCDDHMYLTYVSYWQH